MRRKRVWTFVIIAAALVGLAAGALAIYDRGRPLQVPLKQQLFKGITYNRYVRWSPRALMIPVITVDMKAGGMHFLVTPPDETGSQYPLRARTTSQFLMEYGVQVAINGDSFSPWWSRGVMDYYPHAGDPVQPKGLAESGGKVYWTSDKPLPTLYITARNAFSFDPPRKSYNAISGERLLITGGNVRPNLDNTITQPRSALGYSSNGRYLYLAVVDGRQPFYSEGMTLKELADLMRSLGAHYAMNLDGGGSTTLVVQGTNGQPRVLNSPIDNYIPGRERPVANHLGIFVGK